ncbi:MAG: hypothetical protein AB8B93_19095 [Pseudomonadales bacterium]
MKQHSSSFNREVVIAALLTTVGVVIMNSSWLLSTMAPPPVSGGMGWWLNALVGGYLLWLCSRSNARIGRPTLLLIWFAGSVACAMLNVGLLWSGAWQLLMISITRCLLFYPRPLALLADLTLTAIAGLAALWVSLQSGSLLLTLWSFFLLQAGWTWIDDWQQNRLAASSRDPHQHRFDYAHATATAAIRRMTQQTL